jgi:hypothetical protein
MFSLMIVPEHRSTMPEVSYSQACYYDGTHKNQRYDKANDKSEAVENNLHFL